jgi:S1-C subfamily serine protease
VNKRIWKILAWVVALVFALVVGAAVGGGLVYALMRGGDRLPVVIVQGTDSEGGIVVASVVPGGPAAEAGVVRGDILLEIDGVALERAIDLVLYLGGAEPGDEVELVVLHGDEERTWMATLGERLDRAYLGLAPCGGWAGEVSVHVRGPGSLIVEVMPDSPAESAGLEVGDVILAVDGQRLGPEDLADLIAGYAPGDAVTLLVGRPGEESGEVTVELGQHPEDEDAAYLGVRYVPFPRLGALRAGDPSLAFEFDDLPLDLLEGEFEQGVVIRRVLDDSPASASGLQQGDVITAIDGEAVESPQALREAIAEREPGDTIALTVYRPSDEESREVQVTLGEDPEKEGRAYLGVRVGGFFRVRHFEGHELPRRFKFFGGPWRFMGPVVGFPLDPGEFHFEFYWPPEEDLGDEWLDCLDGSV